MSLVVGTRPCGSKGMAFEGSNEGLEKSVMPPEPPTARKGSCRDDDPRETEEQGAADGGDGEVVEEEAGRFSRQISLATVHTSDEEDEDEDKEESMKLDLGPQVSLKQQLEKDKDDESLNRWKQHLLGAVDLDSVGENLEGEVQITSLSIVSPDRPDIVLPIPEVPKPKGSWFTLKEGSHYRLKFSFTVSKNIVPGLRYTNKVWKAGIKVDSSEEMLGTFGPQQEPYVSELPEERTPSGIFARGSYSARSRFIDDDGKCHLDISYTFQIRKEWQPSS